MGDEPWNPNGGGANSGTVKMWMNTKGYGRGMFESGQVGAQQCWKTA
eukprot:gene3587-1308_t